MEKSHAVWAITAETYTDAISLGAQEVWIKPTRQHKDSTGEFIYPEGMVFQVAVVAYHGYSGVYLGMGKYPGHPCWDFTEDEVVEGVLMNHTWEKRYGVMHTHPDWDALTAAYLLRKVYGITNWSFVSQRDPDQNILNDAWKVVDVGMMHDPIHGRFDHHQMDWNQQKDLSATSLVFDHFRKFIDFSQVVHLTPLVNFVTDADTGKKTAEVKHSALMGMHADLSDFYDTHNPTDMQVVIWAFDYLSRKERQLRKDYYTTIKAQSQIVMHEGDDVCLMFDSSGSLTRRALEWYKLVVFVNYDTNTIGIQRRDGSGINCGDVVHHAIEECLGIMRGDRRDYILAMRDRVGNEEFDETFVKNCIQQVFVELSSWFNHKSGFFSGRGTQGAPSEVPITAEATYLFDMIRIGFKWANIFK